MDDVRQSLDHCVKCGICDTACPVAAVTPIFPGPRYEGPQGERFRDGEPSPDASVDYCSGCGICTQVCPHGVKVFEINSRARAAYKAGVGVRWRDRLIARPAVLGRLAMPAAPLVNRALASPAVRGAVERVVGIHRSAPMPPFARRPFRAPTADHGADAPAGTVAYFHGCSTRWFEPRLGEMAVAVLQRNGFRVVVPPQGCCGLPLQSNGLFDDARRSLRRLAADLVAEARAGHPIVATSTSCGLMLKREGIEVLGLDDEDLWLVSESTYDICEFLMGLHAEGRLDTDFRPVEERIAYHAPCQQQGHGMGKPALDLFALVPGVEVVETAASCCGIAGTYGVKAEKYEIAMAVGRRLFDEVERADPEEVACDSETCRWQITHGSGRPSVHPVEVLFRAYGLS